MQKRESDRKKNLTAINKYKSRLKNLFKIYIAQCEIENKISCSVFLIDVPQCVVTHTRIGIKGRFELSVAEKSMQRYYSRFSSPLCSHSLSRTLTSIIMKTCTCTYTNPLFDCVAIRIDLQTSLLNSSITGHIIHFCFHTPVSYSSISFISHSSNFDHNLHLLACILHLFLHSPLF